MDGLIVIYDACVLYPAPLRDLLLHLACAGLFRARWSEEIHKEWMRNVLKDRPDLKKEQLERTRYLMDQSIRDCLVKDYESLIDSIDLPDLDDRHVVAAAIHASASVIVTYNLRDFPIYKIDKYSIEAQHPDDFISQYFNIAPGVTCDTIKKIRSNLKNPPIDAERYIESLAKQSLPKTVSKLREYISLI